MHEYFITKNDGYGMWINADRYEVRGSLTVFIVDGEDRVLVDSAVIESITEMS